MPHAGIRSLVVAACVAVAVPRAPVAAQTPPPYHVAAALPAVVDAYVLTRFDTDPETGRIFAGSNHGLYWLDPASDAPAWHGPVFKAPITRVRVAANLRRVFFTTRTQAGYVDIATPDQPMAFADLMASGLVYEPSQREVYLTTARRPQVRVFSATTLQDVGTVTAPGWDATLAEAIPGRVFLTVGGKGGLYVINAVSHKIAPWPVAGKIETPLQMDVDPGGRTIFVSFERTVAAIDTNTAAVIGRISQQGTAAIAYDPSTARLLVTRPNDPAPLPIAVLRLDAEGFTEVGRLATPGIGENRLRRSRGGFLQSAGTSWLLWRASPGR